MIAITITPNTDPTTLIGQPATISWTKGNGQPFAVSGRWEAARHMDLGNGVVGIGGMFVDANPLPHSSGRTALFAPYGALVVGG